MFACWFQLELISHDTVFFSHNKSAPAGLISPETNQQTGLEVEALAGQNNMAQWGCHHGT